LLPSYSCKFWLELSQTLSVTTATPTNVAQVLQYNTPQKMSARPPVITKDDFLKLSTAEQDGLATASSTNPDCLPLFSPIQLQFIVLRTLPLPSLLFLLI
jgi:hypothetical protein